MEQKKKILVPTDLSELSKVGVRAALEMAAAQGGEVVVLHVIGYTEVHVHDEAFYTESLAALVLKERHKLLEEFVSRNFVDLPPRVTIRREVQVGVPYKRIVEKASTEGADLIIMSTHGRTGLSHVLIGSVTEKVVQHASCPVLSIRPHEEPRHQEAVAL